MLIPSFVYTFTYAKQGENASISHAASCKINTPYGFAKAIEMMATKVHMQDKAMKLMSVTRQSVVEEIQALDGLLSQKDLANLAPADHMMSGHCLGKDDLCALYRIKTFDNALPQPWLEQTARKFKQYGLAPDYFAAYDWLRCYTVVRYDGPGNAFGTITYLSIELAVAAQQLKKMEEAEMPAAHG